MSTLPIVVIAAAAGLTFVYRLYVRRQAAKLKLSGGRRSLVMNLFGR